VYVLRINEMYNVHCNSELIYVYEKQVSKKSIISEIPANMQILYLPVNTPIIRS
jgi:hypothetical protein